MTNLETDPSALPPPTPDQPLPDRRWARSQDRVVLGVSGGLGRALAIDPLVIRIAFVALALFGGVGILLYFALLLLLADSPTSPQPSVVRRVLGVAAILVSARWLLVGGPRLPSAGWVIALGLLGAAVALWRGRVPVADTAVAPLSEVTSGSSGSSDEGWRQWRTKRRDRPRRARSALGLLTIGAAAVVGACIWLMAGHAHNRGVLAFGWATVVIGAGLIVGAFVGRARWLVVPAVLTTCAAIVASALSFAGVDLSHRSGSRTVVLSSAEAVAGTYRTGLGDFELDLTDYPTDVTTAVEVGVGHLIVDVPQDARVQVNARVGIGTIEALGSTRSGYRRALIIDDNKSGTQTIKLTLAVGVGNVEVHRGDFFDAPKPPRPIPVPQVAPGSPVLRSFSDGTVVLRDGSIDFGDGGRIEADGSFAVPIVEQRPDGSVELENGAVVRADGTVVTPGGFVIHHTVTATSTPSSTTAATTAPTSAPTPTAAPAPTATPAPTTGVQP